MRCERGDGRVDVATAAVHQGTTMVSCASEDESGHTTSEIARLQRNEEATARCTDKKKYVGRY
jgi:hypothetical protein